MRTLTPKERESFNLNILENIAKEGESPVDAKHRLSANSKGIGGATTKLKDKKVERGMLTPVRT